ncbi:hypothetical protein Tco_0031705 [Tanacetum coccineum]
MVNKRQMQTQENKVDEGKALDADLVDTESIRIDSTVQDESTRSGNDTDADDAYIRPIYDEELMAEVQLTAECNIFAIGQQHTEQPEIINEGRVDQYPEQCQVKIPMLDSSSNNQTTDYSKQSLNNKAKIKKEIDVLETMNIELEHSVAKLRKENETLKKHYKDLYDSIKITRSKTIEQTTSLLANNADLKAQIQEKVFAIAALKNDLRKLKGNSVDTKFAKTSVLGKPVLQSLRNQSVVRQPNEIKSKRPQMSKPRFASQVDVNNNFQDQNSSKNMPRFCSNDMVHNHYLDEARKKTPERDRNSKTSMMPSARFQSSTDGSKQKPMSNNQTSRSLPVSKSSSVTITDVPKADHSKSSSSFLDSKHFVCSTCYKCVFNANHDACITKLLKEVNSHAKIQSHKTRNSNKHVDQKSHTQKPGRQIFTRHRFSPNKTSAAYEKTSPRSDLRWKPTGRIFKSVGLSCLDCWNKTVGTSFDLEGSLFWCESSSETVMIQKSFDENKAERGNLAGKGRSDIGHINMEYSAHLTLCFQGSKVNSHAKIQSHKTRNSNKHVDQKCHTQKPGRQIFTRQRFSPNKTSAAYEKTSPRYDLRWKPTGRIFKSVGLRLESLFGPSFDEYFNRENQVVSKPSAVTTADASDKRQQQPDSTLSTSTLATTVTADGNFDVEDKVKTRKPPTRMLSIIQECQHKRSSPSHPKKKNLKKISTAEEFEEKDLNIGGDC